MKGVYIQFVCASFLFLLNSMNSFVAVWPSYAIKNLESDQSPLGFKISKNVGNLIGSIPMLGSLISTMVAGFIVEAVGRKRTQLICGLLYVVAWSLIVTSRSTFQILFARFMMGLSAGLSSVTAIVYSSEITQLSIRGSVSVVTGLLYNCGVMLSYIEGWFLSYDVICYVNLTWAVIYVVLTSFIKESPIYLLKIGKEKEALRSLKFFRGATETTKEVLEELSYMKNQVNQNDIDLELADLSEKAKLQEIERRCELNAEKKNAWVMLFTLPHNRRAVISSITFVILVCAMGMIAVQTYASKFFATAAPSLSPDLCSVIFSLILVASSILSAVVINLLPRRTLMLSTCVVTTFCLAALGAANRWSVPSWVTLGLVTLFVLSYHMGVINIVYVQLSESYAPKVKSAAAVLIYSFASITNFVVLFLYPSAVECIGLDNTFFVFAAIAAFTSVLSYFWIQETRQVPYEQVEKMYQNGIMYKKVSNIES